MVSRLIEWWSKRPVYRVTNHPYEVKACIVERRDPIPFARWEIIKEFRSTSSVDNSTALALLFIKTETRPPAPKRVYFEFDGKGNSL